MSGGTVNSSKNSQFGKTSVFSNETIKDQSSYSHSESKIKFQGVLGIGQTIEFGKTEKSLPKNENLWKDYISQETKFISNNHQAEVKQAIQEIREEIKKLILTSQEMSQDIEVFTVQEQVEFNEYQLNFLQRIKVFIIEFRQNISEASVWMGASSSKNKKKNAFWSKAKDKKTGGEQYLFSSEHTASRSVN